MDSLFVTLTTSLRHQSHYLTILESEDFKNCININSQALGGGSAVNLAVTLMCALKPNLGIGGRMNGLTQHSLWRCTIGISHGNNPGRQQCESASYWWGLCCE